MVAAPPYRCYNLAEQAGRHGASLSNRTESFIMTSHKSRSDRTNIHDTEGLQRRAEEILQPFIHV